MSYTCFVLLNFNFAEFIDQFLNAEAYFWNDFYKESIKPICVLHKCALNDELFLEEVSNFGLLEVGSKNYMQSKHNFIYEISFNGRLKVKGSYVLL